MGTLNIFATSSSEGFLRCLKAPEGRVIVGNDINSLEPHVLAHFSMDEGYQKVYSKTAAPNCIYLYLGANSPQHGDMFRTVYDPDNSSKEMVDIAKKMFSDERQRYKVCVLALAYEGTEYALDRMFKKYKMKVPWEDLCRLVRLFRSSFPGLPRFRASLQQEWQDNGGYIITGRGRPLAVPRDKLKDIIAYFCQTTGHDYVMRWLWHMTQYRNQHTIACTPFLPDFHDATYWTCPNNDKDIQDTKDMIQYGYDALNEELGLSVAFKGESKVGLSMTIK